MRHEERVGMLLLMALLLLHVVVMLLMLLLLLLLGRDLLTVAQVLTQLLLQHLLTRRVGECVGRLMRRENAK